jgi:hypothetical protein
MGTLSNALSFEKVPTPVRLGRFRTGITTGYRFNTPLVYDRCVIIILVVIKQ